jgi:hypothetical protein
MVVMRSEHNNKHDNHKSIMKFSGYKLAYVDVIRDDVQ